MRKSPTVTLLFESLFKFQASCPSIEKGKTVSTGKYSYDYAPLEHIQEVIKPLLIDNKLFYSQGLSECSDGSPGITTLIGHAAGEWMESTSPLLTVKDMTPQELGMSITYQKRYALAAALGLILGGEDDDALAASGKTGTITQKKPTPKPPPPLMEDKIPEDRPHNLAPKKDHPLDTFVITFGKYKDKEFQQLKRAELSQYVAWMRKSAEEVGKPLPGIQLHMVRAAEEYLK